MKHLAFFGNSSELVKAKEVLRERLTSGQTSDLEAWGKQFKLLRMMSDLGKEPDNSISKRKIAD